MIILDTHALIWAADRAILEYAADGHVSVIDASRG